MVGTSILVPSPASSMRHRHRDLDVVALAAEERMRLDAHRDVEIAGRRALVPALPFPARAAASRCCAPGGIRTSTVSVCETRPSPWQVGQALLQPARAVAARAGQVEPWRPPSGSRCRCRCIPGRPSFAAARAPVPLQVAQTSWRVMFRRTWVPSNRLPEIDIEPVLEVGAFFGRCAAAASSLRAEQLAEDVAGSSPLRRRTGARCRRLPRPAAAA